jgi:aspartate aminotransferase
VEAIAGFVLRHGLYLITDEVYQKLVYHGVRHLSPAAVSAEVKRRSVVINGVSKAYAMTGWRIGFAAAEGPIAKAMAELQGHVTTGTGSVAQKAALAALRDDAEAVAKMVKEFEKRRDYTVKRLKAMPGFSTPDPEGAFYVFPTIGKLIGRTVGGKVIRSGDDLAMALLESANVAVVPGAGFGRPDAIRFSYATSMENITKGLDRVEEALRSAS